MSFTEEQIERFNSRVNKTTDGCWIWTGAKSQDGYGSISIKCKNYLAHRFSFELYKGPLKPGSCACHNCPSGDNPSCVNPDHLFEGTKGDNIRDASKKGRLHMGLDNCNGKFTDEQVLEMAATSFKTNLKHREIAKLFGCHRSFIGHLLHGRARPHLQKQIAELRDRMLIEGEDEEC